MFGAINTSSTPPLTPGGPSPSRPSLRRYAESPYDPLLTPAFRHSPKIGEQPWRFPSPSHPLHNAKERDIPLAMLVRGAASPMISGLDNSPLYMVPGSERKKSLFSSPYIPKDLDGFSIFGQSPAPFFFDGTPVSAKSIRSPLSSRSIESPASRSEHKYSRACTLREATKRWEAEAASGTPRKIAAAEGSGLLGPIELQGEDVFSEGMYSSWIDLNAIGEGTTRSPARPATVAESPVVRTQAHKASPQPPQTSLSAVTKGGSSGLMSFGSGLMDAFLSGKTRAKRVERAESSDEDSDDDMNGPSFGSPIRLGMKNRRAISSTWSKDDDGDTEMAEHHPKKRRRTFSGYD